MNNVNLDSKAVTNTCTLLSYAIVLGGFVRRSWKGLCDEPKELRVWVTKR